MTQDYYETLQVHPRADAAAIEAAYTRLRALYEPARLEGAADELVELARQKRDAIERAYAVLADATRRAAYDQAQTSRQGDRGTGRQAGKAAKRDQSISPSAVLLDSLPKDEEALDYRPLAPAGRAERVKGFDSTPLRSLPSRAAGRAAGRAPRQWVAPAGLAGLFVLIVVVSLLLTGGGGPAAAPAAVATTTPSPFDTYEAAIPQARQATEQNPSSAQAWVDLGNVLYDSVQVVRESSPDSPLYQQRLGRWLEATNAYSQALALDPSNASARADMGASSCFYGAGTGDQRFVRNGIADVRQAAQLAPDDARVLLSLGHCLVSAQPPQTDEAIKTWQRILQLNPSSPLAAQAQQLIARYGGQQ